MTDELTPRHDERPVPVEVIPRPNPGKSLFVWMLLSGLIVVGLVVRTVFDEVSDNRAACERTVEVRDDVRAMWLAVFDLFPDGEKVDELRVALDELLPPLTCPPSADQNQIPEEVPTP